MFQEAVVDVPQASSCRVYVIVTIIMKHDIVIPGRTILGTLQEIKSVFKGEVADAPPKVQHTSVEPNVAQVSSAQESASDWTSPFEFDPLTDSQNQAACQMLKEEADSFSKNDHDVGCIPALQLKVRLTDGNPVQKTNQSIPRPLYQEVKDYLEDLLERGCIERSESPYTSPVVCVRKKMAPFDSV